MSDRAWTDNGLWHEPKAHHPATCGGCTSDETRWGKPAVPTAKMPAYYKQGDRNKVVTEEAARLIREHGGRLMLYRDLPPEAQMAVAQYMAIDGEAWEQPDGLGEAMDAHRAKYGVHWGGANKRSTAAWEKKFREFLPFYVERYGDWDFGLVEIPTPALVKEVMSRNMDLTDDWGGDWNAYHNWYKGEGYKHKATGAKPWPVILGSFPDEVLEDGWNRFHQYVERGLEVIPAVWFPGEQAGREDN